MTSETSLERITATIAAISRIGARWPGSNGEREAADVVAEKVRESGRSVKLEPIEVKPEYAPTQALILLVAVIASVLSVSLPLFGTLLFLLATLALYGELTTRLLAVRQLMPTRNSQNIYSPVADSKKPNRVVLSAHYDSGRSGLAFRMQPAWLSRFIQGKLKLSIGPYSLTFPAMMAILIISTLNLFEIDPLGLRMAQFFLTALLIVQIAFLVDIALSPAGPGANDNASGVATVLELARELDGKLENIELELLFPAAEEGLMLGMREWLKAHRSQLDPETWFINLDSLGYGYPRYLTKEGFVTYSNFAPELIEICQKVAERYADNDERPRPYKARLGTDALIPCLAGYRAISLVSLTKDHTMPNYHQPDDTVENLEPEALMANYSFAKEVLLELDRRVKAVD